MSEGVYKVCVTATWKDSTGKVCTATFCKEVKISCGKPCDLKGEFGFTNTGGKFRFKASSNSGYSYEWSFGDGSFYATTENGAPYPNGTIQHTYTRPGTYQITLITTWNGSYTHNAATRAVTGTVFKSSNALITVVKAPTTFKG